MRAICTGLTRLAEHLLEVRSDGARDDVLPAVGLQHRRRDLDRALLVRSHAGRAQEVLGIGQRQALKDAVEHLDQGDQVVDRGVARLARRELRVLADPLKPSMTACCDSSFQWNRKMSLNSGDSPSPEAMPAR